MSRRPRPLPFAILLAALGWTAPAARADEPRTSPGGHIRYWPGELPIIISAPHGGRRKPENIPDRRAGVKTRDGHSAELAAAMRDALRRRLGGAPHLVICELARTKVDCNRDLAEGAEGNAGAERAWREYHGFIGEAQRTVLGTFPHGIYLDVHSHGHPKKRVEIGYLLKKPDLQLTAEQLDADPRIAARSSVRALDKISPAGFAELVRGPTSLGGLLEARGIPAVPAPNAVLDPEDPYFNGAYNIAVHGSRDKDRIDGAQLEIHLQARNTPERRAATAKALAESLDIYFEKHYGMKLPRAAGTLPAQ